MLNDSQNQPPNEYESLLALLPALASAELVHVWEDAFAPAERTWKEIPPRTGFDAGPVGVGPVAVDVVQKHQIAPLARLRHQRTGAGVEIGVREGIRLRSDGLHRRQRQRDGEDHGS